MSRFALVLSLSFFLGVAAMPCSAAVTYEIVDGAAGGQGDYTLTGTITFNSACGTSCTNADILKYSLAYDDNNGSSGTIDFDRAGGDTFSGSYGIFGDASVLNVTATGITFDYAPVAGTNALQLGHKGSDEPSVLWRQGTASGAVEQYGLLSPGIPAGQLFNNVGVTGNPTIFTAVPEPSSFLALGLIGVVLGGRKYFGRGRKLVG